MTSQTTGADLLAADTELAAAAVEARDNPWADVRLMVAWNRAKALRRKGESDER